MVDAIRIAFVIGLMLSFFYIASAAVKTAGVVEDNYTSTFMLVNTPEAPQ